MRYVDKRASDVRATYTKESYTEANLRVGASRNGWDLNLFVENLTNEDLRFTLETGSIAGLDLQNTLVPRTWGIRADRSF